MRKQLRILPTHALANPRISFIVQILAGQPNRASTMSPIDFRPYYQTVKFNSINQNSDTSTLSRLNEILR